MNSITGVVSANNGKAVQLEGSGRWLLPARGAATGPPRLPAVGERVTVELDVAGFVARVTSAPAAPGGPVATPRPDGTDRALLRLTALAAAAALLSGGYNRERAQRPAAELEGWALESKGD